MWTGSGNLQKGSNFASENGFLARPTVCQKFNASVVVNCFCSWAVRENRYWGQVLRGLDTCKSCSKLTKTTFLTAFKKASHTPQLPANVSRCTVLKSAGKHLVACSGGSDIKFWLIEVDLINFEIFNPLLIQDYLQRSLQGVDVFQRTLNQSSTTHLRA